MISVARCMKKVVYLLCDFDGVLSLYLSDLNESSTVHRKRLESMPSDRHEYYQFFSKISCQIVDEIINEAVKNADIVILAVGSARQTRSHERKSSNINQDNGFCFTLFADLAEKNGWIFNRLLMPDYEDNCGTFAQLGHTMGPLRKDINGKHVFHEDDFADQVSWSNVPLLKHGKTTLLAMHLDYLRVHYPSYQYDVTLEFWDDDTHHINACNTYIEALPATTQTHLLTRHFNWTTILSAASNFKNNRGSLKTILQDTIKTKAHDKRLLEPTERRSYSPLSFLNKKSINTESTQFNIPYQWIGISLSTIFLAYWIVGAAKTEPMKMNPLRP